MDLDLKFSPKQWEALTSEGTEILYGGAAGAGKSWLMRMMAILYCLYIPGLQVYLFRRRYSDLLQNHMQGPSGFFATLEPWVKVGKVAINSSDYRIDFFHENGPTSQIYLRHVQHEKDKYNYQGAEIHVLLIDELTLFTESIYTFLRLRTRLGSHKIDYSEVQKSLPWLKPGKFPFIFCGSNPGNIGHLFVKRMWIDSAPPNVIWDVPKEDGKMRRIFIPARLSDNKALLEQDPDYEYRLLAGGGNLAKAMLEGDWNVAEGGAIADVWDEDVHVISQIKIPENAYVVRSLDWGSWHPYAVIYTLILRGEVVETVDGKELYFQPDSQIVFHEMYGWNGNENEGDKSSAYDIGRKIAKYEASVPFRDVIRNGPADNQIFQNRGGIHSTVHDLLVDGYNDMMGELAKEDKSLYSHAVQNLFKRADQSTNSRVQGLNLVRTYLMGSTSGKSKGLYFTDSCRHCIRTIPSLPRSETNPEDVDTKSEDHCYDVVRYNCLATRSTFKALEIVGL